MKPPKNTKNELIIINCKKCHKRFFTEIHPKGFINKVCPYCGYNNSKPKNII